MLIVQTLLELTWKFIVVKTTSHGVDSLRRIVDGSRRDRTRDRRVDEATRELSYSYLLSSVSSPNRSLLSPRDGLAATLAVLIAAAALSLCTTSLSSLCTALCFCCAWPGTSLSSSALTEIRASRSRPLPRPLLPRKAHCNFAGCPLLDIAGSRCLNHPLRFFIAWLRRTLPFLSWFLSFAIYVAVAVANQSLKTWQPETNLTAFSLRSF